jgi:hypothetical protein
MQSDLQRRLESHGLAEKYSVEQADALKVRCRDCGQTVSAECVDLHELDCTGGGQ